MTLKGNRIVSSAGFPNPHLLGVRLPFCFFHATDCRGRFSGVGLVPATGRHGAELVILLFRNKETFSGTDGYEQPQSSEPSGLRAARVDFASHSSLGLSLWMQSPKGLGFQVLSRNKPLMRNGRRACAAAGKLELLSEALNLEPGATLTGKRVSSRVSAPGSETFAGCVVETKRYIAGRGVRARAWGHKHRGSAMQTPKTDMVSRFESGQLANLGGGRIPRWKNMSRKAELRPSMTERIDQSNGWPAQSFNPVPVLDGRKLVKPTDRNGREYPVYSAQESNSRDLMRMAFRTLAAGPILDSEGKSERN